MISKATDERESHALWRCCSPWMVIMESMWGHTLMPSPVYSQEQQAQRGHEGVTLDRSNAGCAGRP